MADPLRIAYFSPLPPARSGIADYSRELLPHLGARAAITVFSDEPGVLVGDGIPVASIGEYAAQRWLFDVALYQMGNSSHHTAIYRMLNRYPGVVVLHDYFLHQFIAHTTTGAGRYPAYARELRYALGDDGYRREEAIRLGHEPPPLVDIPLNDRLLDVSLGLIVHSDYAAGRIRERHPAAQVAVVPQLVASRSGQSRRADLGLAGDIVLFALVGQVTAAKQLPRVLAAIRSLRDEGVPAHLLIAGEVLPEVDLDTILSETGLREHVTVLGYIESLDAFVDWIATADVIINLRYPTLGETSSAALRALDQGRPLIVYDHGWYAELPDSVAAKVTPLDDQRLVEAMLSLATDPEQRATMGDAARAYVARTARPETVADSYTQFLRRLQARWLRGG